jgi:hypothetical protein
MPDHVKNVARALISSSFFVARIKLLCIYKGS